MKYLAILLFAIFCSQFAFAEPIDDIQTYTKEGSREYSIDGTNLRVCASIIGSSNQELKEYCGGKFGDCLDIIDVQELSERASGNRKRISADYINVPSNSLKFTVLNKTGINQKIQVTAFDPNYQINEILELSPKTTRIFHVPSEQPLYVYAGIDIKHHYSLDKHCEEKFGCLKIEDFRIDKWVSQTSARGLGNIIIPDSSGSVKFKITNKHSILTKITLYVRSPDFGACLK